MDELGHLSDGDVERLLSGRKPAGGDDVESVAGFFQDVKSKYVVPPSAATRQAHMAQIMDAAKLSGGPVRPNAAPNPARTSRFLGPQWRRRLALSSLFGSI